MRILCARELQNSINDSVHKLLSDIITEHQLEWFYEVQKAAIKGRNGTEFIFKGLKYNGPEIKSTEGIDVCWVEEAEKVSDSSWELLIPTVRKPSSEIWICFNPKNPTDPTYKRFVANANEDMLVKKVSWRDNPFFPDVLDKERKRLEKEDYVAYKHIWEGEFDERRSGSIYANIIMAARAAGRICPVPYKSTVPVIAALDLGRKHATCIWFAQVVGLEPRIIDYHEAYGDDTDIEKLATVMRKKDYEYEMIWLPHDARHERMGMKSSIATQFTASGIRNKIVPNIAVAAGISRAKALLKEAWVDETKCAEGLHALSAYHYEWDENRGCFKDTPYDDWSADASDALRYLAISLDNRPSPSAKFQPITRPVSWSPI